MYVKADCFYINDLALSTNNQLAIACYKKIFIYNISY